MAAHFALGPPAKILAMNVLLPSGHDSASFLFLFVSAGLARCYL